MAYTTESGRNFWHEFDRHFRYEAAKNGFLDAYKELGGDGALADALLMARANGTYPKSFAEFVDSKRTAVEHLANSQMAFIESKLTSEDDIVSAFEDFAFGVLDSASSDHRTAANDTRHTMSGGAYADGYRHWNGFAQAAITLGLDVDFWSFLQRVNGMAWELHVKSHPLETGDYKRLSDRETSSIKERWLSLSPEQIASKFDEYSAQTEAWISERN